MYKKSINDTFKWKLSAQFYTNKSDALTKNMSNDLPYCVYTLWINFICGVCP